MSEINLHAVSMEQAGCSYVSDKNGDVTDEIDKSKAQSGVEYGCEVPFGILPESPISFE